MTNKNKKKTIKITPKQELIENFNVLSKQDSISVPHRIMLLQAQERMKKGLNPTPSQRAIYNENSGIIDTKVRKDLQKTLAYEKAKYRKNYKKEKAKVNDLFGKGQSRTKGAIEQEYGKGDFWRNKYFRMSNEELQEVIDKYKELNQTINSPKKRNLEIIAKAVSILIESVKRNDISFEEFNKEIKILEKRGKQFGLSKDEINEVIDHVYERNKFSPWDID